MLTSRHSQNKKLITIVLALLAFTLTVIPVGAAKLLNSTPVANYQVVDLSADSTDSQDLVDVNGGIKNFSFTPIRGHAIVYFLDGNQTVLQAIETEVNSGQSFRHGHVGEFDTTVNIGGLSNVQSVTVEFVMDRF